MNELNVFGEKPKEMTAAGVTAAMATTRQAQEVQAAMIRAINFPRNERVSMDRILNACTRKTLAEAAIYSYPRGGTEVSGPSIRLAECLAQNWGNIDFGYVELEQTNGESKVMAYAWDLETNTRQSKVFTVPHRRDTKDGGYALKDSRDIYELVANQASRRVRSCILAVIPGDVIEAAMQQCELTMKAGNGKSLDERITEMILAFANYGVTEEMLSAYIGKKIEAFTDNDVIRMSKVFRSLKDGIVGNEYFLQKLQNSVTAEADPEQKEDPLLNAKNAKEKKAPRPAKAPQPALDPEEEAGGLDDI